MDEPHSEMRPNSRSRRFWAAPGISTQRGVRPSPHSPAMSARKRGSYSGSNGQLMKTSVLARLMRLPDLTADQKAQRFWPAGERFRRTLRNDSAPPAAQGFAKS